MATPVETATPAAALDFARATQEHITSLPSAQPAATDQAAAIPSTRLADFGHALLDNIDKIARFDQSLPGSAAAPSDAPAVNAGFAPVAGIPPQPNAAHQDMQQAIAQLDHAYLFAVQTTLASHGSTETTKIFNTLMKGQ